MPEYKFVNITCYCGVYHPNCRVGQKVKCRCGITLHTQQKKHGDGHVWGTLPNKAKKDGRFKEVISLIQSGASQLEAQFIDAG